MSAIVQQRAFSIGPARIRLILKGDKSTVIPKRPTRPFGRRSKIEIEWPKCENVGRALARHCSKGVISDLEERAKNWRAKARPTVEGRYFIGVDETPLFVQSAEKIFLQQLKRKTVEQLYRRCLDHYDDVRQFDHVVNNSIPIPFFGDLHAYRHSKKRIFTAALNPSDQEFPENKSARFNVKRARSSPQGLEFELTNYFKNNPYRKWFSVFEHVLAGLGASYGGRMLANGSDGVHSTALHVDLCSPIATKPTWTGLRQEEKLSLTEVGREIFECVLELLEPEIIIASVGWDHLESWAGAFKNGRNWHVCARHTTDKSGRTMQIPLIVWIREVEIAKQRVWFANASAANTPFGRFSNERKRAAGEAILAATNG